MTSIAQNVQSSIIARYDAALGNVTPGAKHVLTYERGWWSIADGIDPTAPTRKMRESNLLEHIAAMEDVAAAPSALQSVPALARRAAVAVNQGDKPFGYLAWWTVEQGNRDIDDLKEQANAANVPSWVSESLNGAKPETAWLRATQLGAKGVASASNGSSMARYLVRDAGDRIRILVREVVDENNVSVSIEQMGVLTMKGDAIEFEAATANSVYTLHEKEVRAVLASMRDDLYDRIGKIDDNRIRALILRWLSRRFRVCVRGTGGVYFIPNPAGKADADELLQEITSLRLWMASAHLGTFSIVALQPGGATTVEDFQQSAIEDLKGEIQEVHDNIERYAGQANMNAGSQMFSASTQVQRLDAIREKMETLMGALGDKVGTVEGMLSIARQKALDMERSANVIVLDARKAKNQARDTRIADRKAERLQQAALKSGTAKERGKKQKV